MADWDHRQLCPDGACVGVIGPNGKCNVCGTAAPDWNPDAAAATTGSDDEREQVDDAAHPVPALDPARDGEPDPDWDQRTLCPDGACTGLIAPGGKCSVCGRTAAEITAESAT